MSSRFQTRSHLDFPAEGAGVQEAMVGGHGQGSICVDGGMEMAFTVQWQACCQPESWELDNIGQVNRISRVLTPFPTRDLFLTCPAVITSPRHHLLLQKAAHPVCWKIQCTQPPGSKYTSVTAGIADPSLRATEGHRWKGSQVQTSSRVIGGSISPIYPCPNG